MVNCRNLKFSISVPRNGCLDVSLSSWFTLFFGLIRQSGKLTAVGDGLGEGFDLVFDSLRFSQFLENQLQRGRLCHFTKLPDAALSHVLPSMDNGYAVAQFFDNFQDMRRVNDRFAQIS